MSGDQPLVSAVQNAAPGLTPSLRSTIARGQNPVNDACSMLAPTKAVNHSQ
jgi:hypothetical protein